MSGKHIRAMYIDLDFIYDADDAAQIEANLQQLLRRLKAVQPNTVYVPAFGGFQKSQATDSDASLYLYYPNSKVEEKGHNLLGHVLDGIRTAFGDQIALYVWMPTLSLDIAGLPRVMSWNTETQRAELSTEQYRRLSPYATSVRDALKTLFREMAHSVKTLDGIMFHDDLLLGQLEDASTDGLNAMAAAGFGNSMQALSESQRLAQWTTHNIQALNALAAELMNEVRAVHGSQVKSARNTYALTLTSQSAIEQFSQDLALCLPAYDYVAPMVMPYMEEIPKAQHAAFFADAVAAVKAHGGIDKTVFTLQGQEWHTEQWIDATELTGWMQHILDAGGKHYGYYPDDFLEGHPEARIMRPYMRNQ